MSLDTQHN